MSIIFPLKDVNNWWRLLTPLLSVVYIPFNVQLTTKSTYLKNSYYENRTITSISKKQNGRTKVLEQAHQTLVIVHKAF